MRRNAIIRIVCYSLAMCVLLGILGVGLSFDLAAYRYWTMTGEMYQETVNTQESFPAAAVQDLDIEWTVGTIETKTTDTTSIIVSEYGPSDYTMTTELSGGTLKIRYGNERVFSWVGFSTDEERKNLTIQVPASWVCQELDINAGAAKVDLSNMSIREVNFDGASGKFTVNNCLVGTMDLDTASGDVMFRGELEQLDCDSVSAALYFSLSNAPRELDIDSVSGDLELLIPEWVGFSVHLELLSGSFSSEYATTQVNQRHTYGDGSCRIDIAALSGSVEIRQRHNTPEPTDPQ